MTKNTNDVEIEITYNTGIIYGSREILPTGTGTFYVTSAEGSKSDKEHGNRIDIDGYSNCALPIETFGFSLDDFKCVPINKYGLKEVAKYDNETLVVTANGLFVIYSGGLPSLIGLPSDVQVVSGIWVDEDGYINLPRATLFTKAGNNINALLCGMTSFNVIPLTVLSQTHWISSFIGDSTTPNLYDDRACTVFCEEETSSLYTHYYPKFSDRKSKWYRDFLEGAINSGSHTKSNMILEPIVLDLKSPRYK